MRATLLLFNSYFWKTIYGPVLTFIFPVVLLGILGSIMRLEYIFPGMVAMASMFIATLAMPLGMMEVKNSTLFKVIGSSPISKWKYILATFIFYVFIDFFTIIFLLIAGLAIFNQSVLPDGKLTNGLFSGIFSWFGTFNFMTSNLIHMILGLSIGYMIGTFSKTPQQALTIGLVIALPSMFLSGMVLSVDIIAKSSILNWVSRFSLFRYTTGNIIIASTPLSQTGDFIEKLNISERQIIFKNVITETGISGLTGSSAINQVPAGWTGTLKTGTQVGNIVLKTGDIILWYNNQVVVVRTVTDLLNFLLPLQSKNPTIITGIMKDQFADFQLFKLIFVGDPTLTTVSNSSNNIFDFTHSWGVQKFADINEIRDFVQKFLDRESPDEFMTIWKKISNENDFSWLNIFFKKTNTLYELPEKSLNVFLPMTLTLGFSYLSVHNFSWSAR